MCPVGAVSSFVELGLYVFYVILLENMSYIILLNDVASKGRMKEALIVEPNYLYLFLGLTVS